MNFMPKRKAKVRMGLRQSAVIRCPQFLKYVRDHYCVAWEQGHSPAPEGVCCLGPTEAAHVRSGTDGGVGMKPSDRYALPLCSAHHHRQHQIGEKPFEKETGIDMRSIADGLWERWLKTDTGRKWAQKQEGR